LEIKRFYLIIFCLFFFNISHSMYEPSAPPPPNSYFNSGAYADPVYYVLPDVQTACGISNKELSYVFNREQYVTGPGIVSFLKQNGYDLDILRQHCKRETFILPRIAAIGSGGSLRATIYFAGGMAGAQATGLLNTFLYTATLSGSTWCMGTLMARNISPLDFLPILKDRVKHNIFDIFVMNIRDIANKLYEKWKKRKTISTADIWGAIILDRLLGDLGGEYAQDISFSSVRSMLEASSSYAWPYPLFSLSVAPHDKNKRIKNKQEYKWMCVHPYSVESQFLGGRIDTQEFSSCFDDGKCVELLEEENLATFLGLFGSAYCFSLGDILKLIAESIGDYKFWLELKKIIDKYHLYQGRFLSAKFPNFTYNMQGLPFAQWPKIETQDCGYDFNNPFPPVLSLRDPKTKKIISRNVDMVIDFDASSDAADKGYPEMQYAQMYCKEHEIPFPDIKKPNLKESTSRVIIFDKRVKNNTPVPTVIGIPNVHKFSTLKLDYNDLEFDLLAGGAHETVNNNSKVIAGAIYRKIKDLNGIKSKNEASLGALSNRFGEMKI